MNEKNASCLLSGKAAQFCLALFPLVATSQTHAQQSRSTR